MHINQTATKETCRKQFNKIVDPPNRNAKIWKAFPVSS